VLPHPRASSRRSGREPFSFFHVCLDQLRSLGGLVILRIYYGTDCKNPQGKCDKSPKRPEFLAFGNAVALPTGFVIDRPSGSSPAAA
jgi:hypothetical protein